MPEYSGRTPLIIEFALVVALAFGLMIQTSLAAVFGEGRGASGCGALIRQTA